MNQQAKKILAVVGLLAVIAVFIAIYAGTRPDISTGEKTISVEVIHKDESSKTFEYTKDKTYLGELLLEEGLIQGNEGEFGLYITVVDGEEASYEKDGAYWAFYQGEEYAAQGIDLTPICDGDSFRLVYTYG